MTDFQSLDSETRAIALVGRFLQCWAFMENQLNAAIGKALGLNPLQEGILTSNVQLRDKIHILRTIVGHTLLAPTLERKKFDKLLSDIADKSTHRNMMAHDPFGPTEDDKAVGFLKTRAKGKFSATEVVWTVTKFIEEFDVIGDYEEQLKELVSKLHFSEIMKTAMAKTPLPAPGHSSPGVAGFLGLLAQGTPHSSPSTE